MIIEKCLAYFDDLWHLAGNDLLHDQVDAWDKTVTDHWLRGGRLNETVGLGDFGVDTGVMNAPPAKVPIVVADASQAFVKLLGMSYNRVPLSVSTIEEIEGGGCHWAACYPANKRPRGVKDDAVIFMGRLTRDPNDIRVFGRAIGSRVPGSGVRGRGRGSGERETTASSLAGKEESSRKEDNSGQGKDGPAGAIAQGGNGR